MRVGTWSFHATRRICRALLLIVTAIAMVIPGGDVAMSQSGTGSQLVDLHPASGYVNSFALGIGGGQQVGYGEIPPGGGNNQRPLLWSGTAASVVDLTPTGPSYPPGSWDTVVASGVSGGLQVGYGNRVLFARTHALLWN